MAEGQKGTLSEVNEYYKEAARLGALVAPYRQARLSAIKLLGDPNAATGGFKPDEIILPKTSREISICECTENGDANGTTDQDYGDVASVALGEDQAAAKKLKSLRTISRN